MCHGALAPACLAAKSISRVHAIRFDKVREKKEPDKTETNFYEV
jgi:hypothetical protein